MSSAISTDKVRPDPKTSQSLQPWQFFMLAALACATAVTFVVRGQGITPVVLLAALMGACALVGLAMLRTVAPLVGSGEDRTSMIGQRTRAALEREKMLALRAIKELEFDKAMGKVSDDDFRDMAGRLRARAARLMKQLDAGAGYREMIERDLTKRMGGSGVQQPVAQTAAPVAASTAQNCPSCSTENDSDARFCKACGSKL
jgi:zinc ribbon protein